jgi:uncharacterized membrane protein YedE/YeeE
MEHFTPVSGLVGGPLIGLAVTLLLVLNGRVGGVSGIVGGLLTFDEGRDLGWCAAFVVGLVLGALAYTLAVGAAFIVGVGASLPIIVVGGLLVGSGTRLGSARPRGHGLCGLARLSKRSVVATATFFGVAILTVFLTHHVL